MKSTYTVGDFMTAQVASADETDSVEEGARLLRMVHFRFLPIRDVLGRLVGMLSARDLRCFQTRTRRNGSDENRTTTIEDVMQKPAFCILKTEPLVEAVRRMQYYDLLALPVIHDCKLVGVISYADVMRAFSRTEDQSRQFLT